MINPGGIARWLVLYLAVGATFACAKQERLMTDEVAVGAASRSAPSPAGMAAQETSAEPSQGEAAAGAPAAPAIPADARKLIRTVDLELRVRATEPAAREVQGLAPRLGGYVSEVSAQRVDGLLHYRLVLRIPTGRLDEALAAIRKLAVRVDAENQRVEDVTDRYIDLEARLRTLQATERELQALLAESRQRRSGVEDIMAVYRQLTEIRSQIEILQGQRDALSRLVALSTVNVQLTPVEAARPLSEDDWRPGDTARNSVRMLVAVLRGLGDFLIFGVIVLLPTLVLLRLLYLPVRALWRRFGAGRLRRSRPVPPPVSPPMPPVAAPRKD